MRPTHDIRSVKSLVAAGRKKRNATVKARRLEDDLQRSIVTLHRNLQLVAKRKALLFAVPNGGKRSKTEAGILSGLGVYPGVSDLVLLVFGGPAVLIECKAPGLAALGIKPGAQSDSQIEFMRWCRDAGFDYRLVYTPQDYVNILKEYKVLS